NGPQAMSRIITIAGLLSTALVATAADMPTTNWDSIPTFAGPITIETNSVGPSTRIAGASGVWVLHSPTLSVDCSPPRGCYANKQRIWYNFSCAPRYAIAMERLSMDLNGTLIKREVRDAASATYTAGSDAGAVRVLDAFCPRRERE